MLVYSHEGDYDGGERFYRSLRAAKAGRADEFPDPADRPSIVRYTLPARPTKDDIVSMLNGTGFAAEVDYLPD